MCPRNLQQTRCKMGQVPSKKGEEPIMFQRSFNTIVKWRSWSEVICLSREREREGENCAIRSERELYLIVQLDPNNVYLHSAAPCTIHCTPMFRL